MYKNKLTQTALCVAAALASTSTIAANSWLSRVSTVDQHQQKKVFAANRMQSLSAVSTDSSTAIFDITVSLYNNPEGAEQNAYEEIFKNFADAICEQTNGEHKLGTVSVFRENKHRSKSDIIWGSREWPRANASGFGANGMHIWFGDVFPNGAGAGKDHDMLQDPKGAGYTLAHEWGHYAYGLFDEYQGVAESADANSPIKTDLATNSIMSNQWKALQGDMLWLNHSTATNIGNVDRTAQGRVYGKSAWEVLLQDAKDDPKLGRKTAQPERTRFLTLANNAPDDVTPVKIELPSAQASCRDQLDVVWVEGDIDMQVVIDRSGSMGGAAINNAKQAAKILVDATAEGTTSMGLVSFSSYYNVIQDFPVTKIESPDVSVKTELKAAIDSIRAGGSTALYDGSQLALDNLEQYQQTQASGAPGVVFVLADGDDNDSRLSQASVISNYQQANMPIFSFGYGSASPTGPLLTLANATGGKYFSSPTSLAEIVDAFLQANAIATDNQNLASTTYSIDSTQSASQPIYVDSGLDNINVFVNHNADLADLELALFDGAGTLVTDIDFNCIDTASTQSCSANISNQKLSAHGAGQWQLQLTNLNQSTSLTAAVNVSAEPSLSGTYSVNVEGVDGNAVTYPAPMILTTAITKDKLITGANVKATITDPNQVKSELEMFDNGIGGDAVSGDGIYSVIAPYNQNGIYQVEVHVDNNDSNAVYTTTGLLTPTIDGSVPEAETLPSIDENFVRIAKTSLVVSDVPYSDSNDSYYLSDDLTPSNAGIEGMVDSQGDLDFYQIENIDTTSEFVVRVSDLSLGMKPSLTLYKSDGITVIDQDITLDTNPSKTGYVFYKVATTDLESTLYAAVQHEDTTATTGGYQISAGAPLNTDTPPNNAPVAAEDVASIWSGQTTVINVLENDTDLDGDSLSIDSVQNNGTLGVVSLVDGQITYDASTAFDDEVPGTVISDSFKYIVTDNNGAFVEGQVTISVSINTPPTAEADIVYVDENGTVNISPLQNDSDADGHSITLIDYLDTLTGELTDNNDGTWTYSTNGQFDSLTKGEQVTDALTYTIADEVGSESMAQVSVIITGINTIPSAEADEVSTSKSSTVLIDALVNDSDEDGDALSVVSLDVEGIKGTVTDNGDGTFTYDPAGKFADLYAGSSATETFSYAVSDGSEQVSTTVTVTVNGEGSKPEVEKSSSSSGGSLFWLTLLLAPFSLLRRRKK